MAHWYVRPSAGPQGTSGVDWNHAFAGFSGITWGSIAAGDTIWVAAGAYGQLGWQKGGSSDTNRITMQAVLSSDTNILNQGALSPGFNVGRTDAVTTANAIVITSTGGDCISISTWNFPGCSQYLTIDGRVWHGIVCHQWGSPGPVGVIFDGGTTSFQYITLRYIQVIGPGVINQPDSSATCRGFDLTPNATVDHLVVQWCDAGNGGDAGFYISAGGSGVLACLVEYTDAHDHDVRPSTRATSHPNEMYMGTWQSGVVRYCRLYHVYIEGLFWENNGNHVEVYGNLFYQGGPGISGAFETGRGLTLQRPGDSVQVYNNTFVDLPAGGNTLGTSTDVNQMNAPYPIDYCDARNNLYVNTVQNYPPVNGSKTIPNVTPATSRIVDYNFYGPSATGKEAGETHSIANGAQPFVAYATPYTAASENNDYHIVGTIAANYPRQKGTPIPPIAADAIGKPSQYHIDRDGTDRSVGDGTAGPGTGQWSMGAYEFVSTSPGLKPLAGTISAKATVTGKFIKVDLFGSIHAKASASATIQFGTLKGAITAKASASATISFPGTIGTWDDPAIFWDDTQQPWNAQIHYQQLLVGTAACKATVHGNLSGLTTQPGTWNDPSTTWDSSSVPWDSAGHPTNALAGSISAKATVSGTLVKRTLAIASTPIVTEDEFNQMDLTSLFPWMTEYGIDPTDRGEREMRDLMITVRRIMDNGYFQVDWDSAVALYQAFALSGRDVVTNTASNLQQLIMDCADYIDVAWGQTPPAQASLDPAPVIPPDDFTRDQFTPVGGMGGGTVKVQQPTEADDTLHSIQYGRFVDLISEGEIVGLCDDNNGYFPLVSNNAFARGVYFNKTAIRRHDGTLNFNGIQIGQTFGTSIQAPLPFFSDTEDTVAIGVEVKFGQPISFTIDDYADQAVVGVRIPQLYTTDSKGNIVLYRVGFYFHVSRNGVGVLNWPQAATGKIVEVYGKCTSDYISVQTIPLPHSADPLSDVFTIQMIRNSGDDQNSKSRSQTWFDSCTRVINAKLNYPYSALVAIEVDASQFSDIPTRQYRMKGKKVLVPANYFPDTRGYSRNQGNGTNTGVYQPWNGTFYSAWTNNPAWIFYDLASSFRYGLGNYYYAQIDKWTLYKIAQYCDQYIPDGFGGYEPRFTCNCYLQTRQDAFKMMQDLGSVFRAMLYWDGGAIVPVQDCPKNLTMTFTNANVKDGLFTYVGTARRSRNTVIKVRWNDPNDWYNSKAEYVEDANLINKLGYRMIEVAAFGCTSRGQAHRLGRYMLLTDTTETDSVNFVAGTEAAYLRPGDLIGIMDNDRAGLKQGGRLVAYAGSPAGTAVVLDRLVTVEPGVTNYIYFYAAKDSLWTGDPTITSESQIAQIRPGLLQVCTILNAAGSYQTLSITPGISGAVVPINAIFTVHSATLSLATFRVVQITEQEGPEYAISGQLYNYSKFNAIDYNYALAKINYTVFPNLGSVLRPNGLTATFHFVANPEGIVYFINLSWKAPPDRSVVKYMIYYTPPHGNNTLLSEVAAGGMYEFEFKVPGLYMFQVFAVNSIEVRSDPAVVSITLPDAAHVPLYRATGLELVEISAIDKLILQRYPQQKLTIGGENDTEFVTRDVQFKWRINSAVYASDLNSQEPYGASTGQYDALFMDYAVRISDLSERSNTYYVKDPYFYFAITENQRVFGVATHYFKVTVTPRNIYGIPGTGEAFWVSNPPPKRVKNVTNSYTANTVTMNWTNPSDPDLAMVEVYQSVYNDFGSAKKINAITVTDANGNVVQSSSFTFRDLTSGTKYFFWLRPVDAFGQPAPLESGRAVIPH